MARLRALFLLFNDEPTQANEPALSLVESAWRGLLRFSRRVATVTEPETQAVPKKDSGAKASPPKEFRPVEVRKMRCAEVEDPRENFSNKGRGVAVLFVEKRAKAFLTKGALGLAVSLGIARVQTKQGAGRAVERNEKEHGAWLGRKKLSAWCGWGRMRERGA